MSTFREDIIGFAGSRTHSIISHPVDRDAMTLAIVNNLTGNGWTIVSGPTPEGFGDGYELYSRQAPWHDQNNVPSWYVGARAYITIINSVSHSIFVRPGDYYNGVLTNSGPPSIPLRLLGNLFDYHVLGNPYELRVWNENTAPENLRGAYIGVLNVPKPVQQQQKVISCIVGTGGFKIETNQLRGANVLYHTWRTKDANLTAIQDDKLNFLTVNSGNMRLAGRRVWNVNRDALMADHTLWKYFILPAAVAFHKAGDTQPLYFGFMWDTFLASEAFQMNSVVSIGSKQFTMIGGDTGAANSHPTVMFVNTSG